VGSAFSPLGAFRADAPLLPSACDAARHFLNEVPPLGRRGDISRIYLHWSVEAFGCIDALYHAVVALRDGAWVIAPSHDVRPNMLSSFSGDYAKNTYHRNRGSVGIAIDGLDGAGVTPYDFGSDAPQMHEIEHLCAGAAAFAAAYEIDALGISYAAYDGDPYTGEPTIQTHAEAAHRPGNPPQYDPYFLTDAPPDGDVRWDLMSLVRLPAGVAPSFAMAVTTGDELRQRIHRYKLQLMGRAA